MVGKDLSEGFAGRKQAQKRVQQSRLIFTTCAGAGLGLLRTEHFGVVIVDEASQLTEPATLIPLTKGCQRAVLVGDHVQLRATVQKHAVLSAFDVSLFERLYTSADSKGVARVMLDTQYRMHPDICAFSSVEFYDGKLKSAESLSRVALPASQFLWPAGARKVFVRCSDVEDIGQQSKANSGQVRVCKQICDLLQNESPESQPRAQNGTTTETTTPSSSATEIAILTPYTRQREPLQKALPKYTVSSIDGFQGREADIIIFVTTRSNPHNDIGFLKDLRRLNVAMTRAKAGVIVVGNISTLIEPSDGNEEEESKRVWRRLVQACTETRVEVPAGGDES